MAQQPIKISCRNLWKIFGPYPEPLLHALQQQPEQVDAHAEGHIVAVRDVSFDVRQGEIFVVMGLSGSGKSTLVRCVARLLRPDAGQILIDGQDLALLDERALREVRRHKLSMVFQHFGLFPHRRVIDNVAYGLEVQGVPREQRYDQARMALETVGLRGWESHYPHELSGGMQQRVGLARALSVDPEILLFDEPFSALDPLIRREMQEELLELQQTMHRTLLFITHDFMEALKLGNHVAIMRDGRLEQIGTPEEIIANPVNEYVRKFTQDVPKGRVLRAQSVMGPLQPAGEYPPVQATQSLESILPLLLDGHERLTVIDVHGTPIGTVERQAVGRALGAAPDGN